MTRARQGRGRRRGRGAGDPIREGEDGQTLLDQQLPAIGSQPDQGGAAGVVREGRFLCTPAPVPPGGARAFEGGCVRRVQSGVVGDEPGVEGEAAAPASVAEQAEGGEVAGPERPA